MGTTSRRLSFAFAIFFFGVTLQPLSAQDEYSHARIVRLSFVEGNVTLLRPASTDWAAAAVNTPIEEGFQLSTDKSSFAEVEFENGSTARVGELSLLKFDQLGLTETGDELNRLTLDHGYGTFHARPEKMSAFNVSASDSSFAPHGKAEFRVDLDRGQIRLEVLKGSVEVSGPEVTTTVAKDNVLEIAPGMEQSFTLSAGIQPDDWDQWVSERDQQQTTAAAVAPPGGVSPQAPAYGWSDLNQYGTWSYFDGYGYGWVPDAWGSWSPFSLGQWAWYPGGLGYTWISYEPWGWLPYHFGGWDYDALFGWAWFPGFDWGFSPGVVNWYQGPGWVGWAPRPPGSGGLGGGRLPKPPKGCPAGCLNAVNTTTFQKGGPLQERQFLKVDPQQGVPVKQPAIEPGLLAMLPGSPAKLSSAQRAIITRSSGNAAAAFERSAPASPRAGEWTRHAPESAFASPPTSVRGTANEYWSGHSGSSPSIHSGGGYSGSATHSGGGSFSAASHGGGGGSSSGGGSHGGGGGGGSGGGHH